jgi:hypothetical protein
MVPLNPENRDAGSAESGKPAAVPLSPESLRRLRESGGSVPAVLCQRFCDGRSVTAVRDE